MQGQNVSMKYIQQPDRSLITGAQAKAIRRHARSIWINLFTRGLALKTWSRMPRSIEDKYVCEMEEQWPILWYCKNHWKVNYLVTQNYPIWHKTHQKNLGKDNNTETKGPTQKRHRTTTEGNDTGDSQIDPKTDIEPKALEDDSNIALLSWLNKDICKGPRRDTSRPKAKPLRDPL